MITPKPVMCSITGCFKPCKYVVTTKKGYKSLCEYHFANDPSKQMEIR